MNQLPANSSPEPSLSQQIALEALRQSHDTFNLAQRSLHLALVMTGISAIAVVVGVGLVLTDKAPVGSITTTSGLLSGAGFLQLAKEAGDQLQEANERLDRLTASSNTYPMS